MIKNKFIVALLENLPQSVLQQYETFALGKTLGSFVIFSISFSIIQFQLGSGQMLADVLYQLRSRKLFKGKYSLPLKGLIVFVVYIFPYICVSIPFLFFFESDRTEWLQENGFDVENLDWKVKQQEVARYVLFAFVGVLIFAALMYKIYNYVKSKRTKTIQLQLQLREPS